MGRASRTIAAALLAASVGMTAFSLASLWLGGAEVLPDRPSAGEIVTFTSIFLTFPLVGFVVAWKRPDNPVGWLFLVIGLTIALSVFSSEYAGWSVYAGADMPGAVVVAWVGSWGWTVAYSIALPLALMLFPTGRLPSRRWQAPVIVGIAGASVTIVAAAIRPGSLADWHDRLLNPFGAVGALGEAATVLAGYEPLATLYMIILSLAALSTRYRRADAERQQLKWVLYPASLLLVAGGLAVITDLEVAFDALLVLLAALPIGAGIAILRYRLYDIDVVIRRTLVYAALVAVLAVVYVALVLVLQLALSSVTGNDTLPVALSTLAIAALFGPVRARVRAVVDRRFYRSRYDAQRTLDAFAGRLRDEVELDTVGGALVTLAGQAVQPQSASLWIRSRSAA